jgi:hypothetical protein
MRRFMVHLVTEVEFEEGDEASDVAAQNYQKHLKETVQNADRSDRFNDKDKAAIREIARGWSFFAKIRFKALHETIRRRGIPYYAHAHAAQDARQQRARWSRYPQNPETPPTGSLWPSSNPRRAKFKFSASLAPRSTTHGGGASRANPPRQAVCRASPLLAGVCCYFISRPCVNRLRGVKCPHERDGSLPQVRRDVPLRSEHVACVRRAHASRDGAAKRRHGEEAGDARIRGEVAAERARAAG